jgi:hypothetical protein
MPNDQYIPPQQKQLICRPPISIKVQEIAYQTGISKAFRRGSCAMIVQLCLHSVYIGNGLRQRLEAGVGAWGQSQEGIVEIRGVHSSELLPHKQEYYWRRRTTVVAGTQCIYWMKFHTSYAVPSSSGLWMALKTSRTIDTDNVRRVCLTVAVLVYNAHK